MDLGRDLPTTAADGEELRKAGEASMRAEDYLAFLPTSPEATPEELRARPITSGGPVAP